MTHVMLDIETLGLEPGAVVTSIGAVEFDADGLGREFYESIGMVSCEDAGLEIDADTLAWWLDQPRSPEELRGGDDLGRVLGKFSMWYPDDAEVWANSPAFDCVIIEAAYDAIDETPPWGYWAQRDLRTLLKVHGDPGIEQQGEEHHALDDAVYQARQASAVLRKIGSDE